MTDETNKAPASPSLADTLFGDDAASGDAASGAKAAGLLAADIVTVSGTVYVVDRARAWPAMVPSRVPALEILRGRATAVGAEDVTRQMLEKLTPLEQSVLRPNDLQPQAEPLREAVIMLWRHKVAIMAKPDKGGEMSRSALDALLTETDAVVNALVAPEGFPPDLAEAFANIRSALARNAASLAQAESDLIRRMTATNLPVVKADVAKMTSMESVVADKDKRPPINKPLAIAAGVIFTIGLAFHGIGYLEKLNAPKPDKALEVIPTGLVQAHTKKGAPAVLMPLTPGAKVNDAVKEEVMKQAEKEGKKVRQLGPGEFIIQ